MNHFILTFFTTLTDYILQSIFPRSPLVQETSYGEFESSSARYKRIAFFHKIITVALTIGAWIGLFKALLWFDLKYSLQVQDLVYRYNGSKVMLLLAIFPLSLMIARWVSERMLVFYLKDEGDYYTRYKELLRKYDRRKSYRFLFNLSLVITLVFGFLFSDWYMHIGASKITLNPFTKLSAKTYQYKDIIYLSTYKYADDADAYTPGVHNFSIMFKDSFVWSSLDGNLVPDTASENEVLQFLALKSGVKPDTTWRVHVKNKFKSGD